MAGDAIILHPQAAKPSLKITGRYLKPPVDSRRCDVIFYRMNEGCWDIQCNGAMRSTKAHQIVDSVIQHVQFLQDPSIVVGEPRLSRFVEILKRQDTNVYEPDVPGREN